MTFTPKWLAIVALSASIMACSPYKMPIQQGNLLSEKSLAAVHVGMSEQALHRTLGTPMLTTLFVDHQYTYIYSLEPSYGKSLRRELIVLMENGKVKKIEKRAVH